MPPYPPANLDTSFFAVLVRRTLDHHRKELSLEERDQPDTKAAIVRDIRAGEFPRFIAVIEFNPVEGWSKDISADIAQTIIDEHDDDRNWDHDILNFVESTLHTIIRRAA